MKPVRDTKNLKGGDHVEKEIVKKEEDQISEDLLLTDELELEEKELFLTNAKTM